MTAIAGSMAEAFYGVPQHLKEECRKRLSEDIISILDAYEELIAGKKINVTKYIDDLVSLEAVQESFEKLTNGKDAAVKIIVKP